MPKKSHADVLWRSSFKVLSRCFTFVFGAMAGVALMLSITDGLAGGPLLGVAACLGTVSLVRRVWGARILFGEFDLHVVNPLLTHSIPYRSIKSVTSTGNGTLTVVTSRGEAIYSAGFSGSIIDSFVGSTDRAVEEVVVRVGRGRRSTEVPFVTKRYDIAWIADLSAAGVLFAVILAGIVGA